MIFFKPFKSLAGKFRTISIKYTHDGTKMVYMFLTFLKKFPSWSLKFYIIRSIMDWNKSKINERTPLCGNFSSPFRSNCPRWASLLTNSWSFLACHATITFTDPGRRGVVHVLVSSVLLCCSCRSLGKITFYWTALYRCVLYIDFMIYQKACPTRLGKM